MAKPGQSYGDHCREKADQGFATGWRCAECALLWWPLAKARDAQAHAAEHDHAILIAPAPFQVVG